MILIGELSLWVALLMAGWATTVSIVGGLSRRADLIRSGERAMYVTFGFTLLSSLGLWTALFSRDFAIRYVASYTSRNLPTLYTVTALWAGPAGSLLLWTLLLTTCSAIAVASHRHAHRELMPWVTGTLGIIALFFLGTSAFGANPFERLEWIPVDGRGMNPQLQNPGMAMHPPMLYLGLVATAVPFAFAIGALVSRTFDAAWLATVRRWASLSWFFLTIGMVLGMRWAYVELGWAGYWAWDAVENAALLPWLTATAFLHSVIVQEKRGMLRAWNVTLVAVTFLLSIFGVFIARSGVIGSVHAFAQSPVGNWFLGFVIVATTMTAVLVRTRLADLQSTAQLEHVVSREGALLTISIVLVAIGGATLSGMLVPIVSGAVNGETLAVSPSFFTAVNGPFGLLLLALTGIGPLLAWPRACDANLRRRVVWPVVVGATVSVVLVVLGMRAWYALMSYALAGFATAAIVQKYVSGIGGRRRLHHEGLFAAAFRLVAHDRRQYGGYIVHLGVVLLFCAFAGLVFRTEVRAVLTTGESITTTDAYGSAWTFTSQGISMYDELNRQVIVVGLAVTRNGQSMGLLTSEQRQYVDSRGEPTFDATTEIGLLETLQQDVYLVFTGAVDKDTAAVRIHFNPLVSWVWIGGLVMAFGGLVVMWPQARRAVSLPDVAR